jgi:hypothetical protein
MKMTRLPALARTLAAAAACVLVAACSDLPTGKPAQQAKYQVLIVDETTAQVYAQVFADGSVQGGIALPTGAQRHLVLRLLTDTNGDVGIGPGDEIRISTLNTVVAGFHADSQSGNIVHGTLTGVSQGATTLRIQYIQGGFTAYDSPGIPVTVS